MIDCQDASKSRQPPFLRQRELHASNQSVCRIKQATHQQIPQRAV